MKKIIGAIALTLVLVFGLSGCLAAEDFMTDMRSTVKGLPMVIKTYDVNSQLIDRIEAESIDISSDGTFATVQGSEVMSKSSVLEIMVGGQPMYHVGSTLIAHDSALVDYFDELPTTFDITNTDRSVPFMDRMIAHFRNDWSGHAMIILVRSQNGTPLATFVGDKVRLSATEVDKSTAIYIDGMRLFLYRCDYTIYPVSLFD